MLSIEEAHGYFYIFFLATTQGKKSIFMEAHRATQLNQASTNTMNNAELCIRILLLIQNPNKNFF